MDQVYEIITSAETDGVKVDVVAYRVLKGSADPRTAETLFFAAQAGMRLKMVRIVLNNSIVRVEPGALYHMYGNLEMRTSTGGGVLKGLARKLTSGESFFVNEIRGSGVIYLEPTFGHFLLHRLNANDEGIICDKGMFYAGTNAINIGANISSGAFGGEGWWQTSIDGHGIAVLFSPVPVEEILKISLKNHKLSVDGNFALMRTKGIVFRTEKSSKSWVATSVSGEGLLQTFSGTGTVWIAPTQGVYERMATPKGLHSLIHPPGSKGTFTGISNGKRG